MSLDLFLHGNNRPVLRGTLKDISDALYQVQDAINNGSFGVDAATVTFDPTDTDLTATDVEAAIKENWSEIRSIDIDGNERTIQVRADTAANLASADDVFAERELVFETDTGLSKLGDGSTEYTNLPYITPEVDVDDKVDGATSATDNEVVLFDGATGKVVQTLSQAFTFLSGKVSPPIVALTQAEYDALSESEQGAAILYVIVDDPAPDPEEVVLLYQAGGVQASNTSSHVAVDFDPADMEVGDTLLILSGARGATTYEPNAVTPSAVLTLDTIASVDTQTSGDGTSGARYSRATATTAEIDAIGSSDFFDITVGFSGSQYQSGSFILLIKGSYSVVGGDSAEGSSGSLELEPVPDTSFAEGDIRIDLVVQATGGATAITAPAEVQEITQTLSAGSSSELRMTFGTTETDIATARTWGVSSAGTSTAAGVSIVLRPA